MRQAAAQALGLSGHGKVREHTEVLTCSGTIVVLLQLIHDEIQRRLTSESETVRLDALKKVSVCVLLTSTHTHLTHSLHPSPHTHTPHSLHPSPHTHTPSSSTLVAALPKANDLTPSSSLPLLLQRRPCLHQNRGCSSKNRPHLGISPTDFFAL